MAEIEKLNKVFVLSPETKKELASAFPFMPEEEKKEFLAYIDELLKKQDEIITYILKNNPGFLMELKAFNAQSEKKYIQGVEATFKDQENIDLLALEEELKKI